MPHTIEYQKRAIDYRARYGKRAALHLILDGYYNSHQLYAITIRKRRMSKGTLPVLRMKRYIVMSADNVNDATADYANKGTKIPVEHIKRIRKKG